MGDLLYEKIRLLGREIQAIRLDEEINSNNELMIVDKAREIVMDVYYEKDWDAHKWMMDTGASDEKLKIKFARYVDAAMKHIEIKKIASRMLAQGWDIKEIQEITELSTDTINNLKNKIECSPES